jgi:hypothetical protein
MRWLNRLTAAAMVASFLAGCGSGAGDRLVLQFLGFEDPENGQADGVSATHAEVDVVPSICPDGSVEPFFETAAVAAFVNQSGSDILLDRIDIDPRAAGAAQVRRNVSAIAFGRRCSGTGDTCAVDADCGAGGLGACQSSTSRVSFLMFDFSTKALVSVGTFDVPITFSGEDASGERFTVRTSLTVTFEDFANCESSGSDL